MATTRYGENATPDGTHINAFSVINEFRSMWVGGIPFGAEQSSKSSGGLGTARSGLPDPRFARGNERAPADAGAFH
jgi:hypothetical protein